MAKKRLRITAVESSFKETSSGKAGKFYWEQFQRAAAERDIDFNLVSSPNALRLHRLLRRSDLYLLVFNETKTLNDPRLLREAKILETMLEGELVVNTTKDGNIIGHKGRLNKFLARNGINVPRQFCQGDKDLEYPIFAIPHTLSGQPIQIINKGEPPWDHCCTKQIDTVHRLNGKDYYVYIRALCTGSSILALTPRMRPVEDGSPSVHGKDAKPEAAMFDLAYREIVVPRMMELKSICHDLAKVLPMGSYVHDLLPQAGSKTIYICETGWKFMDKPMMKFTKEIAKDIKEFQFHNFAMVREQVTIFEKYIDKENTTSD